MTLLNKVGIPEKGEHFPHHLSGGHSSGAIARALAMMPKSCF